MIGKDDSQFTVEFKDHYEILPNMSLKIKKMKLGGKKVIKNFYYGSNNTNKINKNYIIKEIKNIKIRQAF